MWITLLLLWIFGKASGTPGSIIASLYPNLTLEEKGKIFILLNCKPTCIYIIFSWKRNCLIWTCIKIFHNILYILYAACVKRNYNINFYINSKIIKRFYLPFYNTCSNCKIFVVPMNQELKSHISNETNCFWYNVVIKVFPPLCWFHN